ncbi:MAG: polysaccharide biosynthesis/export family protein [Nitrospirota bacterium]
MFIFLRCKIKKLICLAYAAFLTVFITIFITACGGNRIADHREIDPPFLKDSKAEKLRDIMLKSATMRNTDPNADYIIGPDDVIEIDVFQAEELKRTVRVSSLGYIGLPLIDQIKAKGLTVTQLEKEIARQLEKYLNEPCVSVYVKEYKAQRIGVIGAVDKPQVYTITGQRYLLDMLSMAGGLTKEASTICYVLRPVNNQEQGTETLVIDLNELFEEGNLSLNIPVFNGDVINVPKGGVVFVDGAVKKPGVFKLEGRATLVQVIAMAEGLRYEANQSDIKIFREDGGAMRKVISADYDAIKEGKDSDIQIRENDIIIIPKSGVKNFLSGFINTIRGFISFGKAL